MAIDSRVLKRLRAMGAQAEISAVGNTDEQALQVPDLYPDWDSLKDGTHLTKDQRVNHKGILYNVLSDHDKQADRAPADTSSLFAKVLVQEPGVITDWEQPGSSNGYSEGDKVRHKGKIWESLVNNNVWEPGVVGTEGQWCEVTE